MRRSAALVPSCDKEHGGAVDRRAGYHTETNTNRGAFDRGAVLRWRTGQRSAAVCSAGGAGVCACTGSAETRLTKLSSCLNRNRRVDHTHQRAD